MCDFGNRDDDTSLVNVYATEVGRLVKYHADGLVTGSEMLQEIVEVVIRMTDDYMRSACVCALEGANTVGLMLLRAYDENAGR